MKNMLKKMRERGSWWMALLFILVGLILNQISGNLGFEFSLGIIWVLVGFLILSVLVSLLIRLVDIKAEKQVKDYLSLVSWVYIVLVATSLVTPLALWVNTMLRGLF
ncbi:hypothetical protein K8R33_02920 [archaeon]|nr:hypothetical protein [archaeon]